MLKATTQFQVMGLVILILQEYFTKASFSTSSKELQALVRYLVSQDNQSQHKFL